jgi:hypothetical protein
MWVFDTGSVAHIGNSQQDVHSKRPLARNEVTSVGNGNRVYVVAIGTLPLRLPSVLILVLNKMLLCSRIKYEYCKWVSHGSRHIFL